jgi:serine/threonine protein kinase
MDISSLLRETLIITDTAVTTANTQPITRVTSAAAAAASGAINMTEVLRRIAESIPVKPIASSPADRVSSPPASASAAAARSALRHTTTAAASHRPPTSAAAAASLRRSAELLTPHMAPRVARSVTTDLLATSIPEPSPYATLIPPGHELYRLPLLLDNKIALSSVLGSGVYSTVFAGLRLRDQLPVAVKVEPIDNRASTRLMPIDADLLAMICNSRTPDIAPTIVACGVVAPLTEQQCTSRDPYAAYVSPDASHLAANEGFMYLAMERLENTLENTMKSLKPLSRTAKPKFSALGTHLMAHQLLGHLRDLHDMGFLHRDLKLENMMVRGNQIKIVDFGLARCIYERDSESGTVMYDRIVPRDLSTIHAGTPLFQSITAHQKQRQSRADELESFFYVMYYCLFGELPWEDVENHDPALASRDKEAWVRQATALIGRRKESMSPAQYRARGVPSALLNILVEARRCEYDERPDYEGLLAGIETAVGTPIEGQLMDWMVDEGAFRERLRSPLNHR